jgi:hypothetical protein
MKSTTCRTNILSAGQAQVLRAQLRGRLIVVCFGAGVDSTAMLVALREAGIRPHVITFADTGGEKPETLAHVDAVNDVLRSWRWPPIDVVRKKPLPTTGYADLYGNCLKNETLPSLAFGMKSCSIKWKHDPQDQFIQGVERGPNAGPAHPVWLEAQRTGQRIVKLIGYDCGKADLRRAQAEVPPDSAFDYAYPLQMLGWARPACVRAISQAMGDHLVPLKSACFFCPASKQWELFWLAAHHPELLERALMLERVAMTGRHSQFDEALFGQPWAVFVRTVRPAPSSTKTIGLGRSFAWNQWAWVNAVVGEDQRVRRGASDRARFNALSEELRDEGNALDARAARVIPIQAARAGTAMGAA